ncbi:MAG: HEPN domain-containing protein [Firmicutes bacterium]|nr:HEPN domain-containing protein [Bacillota bacterium]
MASSYLTKARVRRKALEVYLADQDFSDVVREAQEIVELTTKAILRAIGVEPPKRHHVGDLIAEYQDRLPEGRWAELVKASKWLRKERELAFYGDVDFIPTDEYTEEDASRAIQAADLAIELAARVLGKSGSDIQSP